MATETQPQKRTDIDIDYFRQRLLEEKALAEDTINRTREDNASGLNFTGEADRAELTNADENHPGDVGTELQLREQDLALIENARQLLVQINRAIEKIDEGTYGLSDRSGEPILAERLEAIPYAIFTAEEQGILEISN